MLNSQINLWLSVKFNAQFTEEQNKFQIEQK